MLLRLLRLWRVAGQDLRLLWFALRHPARPLWLLPAVLVLAIYAVEPLNIALPLLGMIDDFVLLPLALHVLLKLLPLEIRAGFTARTALR